MDFSRDFQPRQIVCLEHQDTRLYAEVIQVVESRQLCWVRPLLLVKFTFNHEPNINLPLNLPLYDLRYSADLLWSLTSFRPALDTEVIPLLVQLEALAPPADRSLGSQQQFNQFIRQVWQADQKQRGNEG